MFTSRIIMSLRAKEYSLFSLFLFTDRRIDRQTNKQAGRQIDKQIGDRQTNRQTGRQIDKQTDRQAGRQTDIQADRQTDGEWKISAQTHSSPHLKSENGLCSYCNIMLLTAG